MSTLEGLPAGVEARPIEQADVSAWAELWAAAEKVDQRGENYDADDLLEELSHPRLDAEKDTIGLWADGAMIAYAAVHWRVNVVDVHRLGVGGTVHPQWRGQGVGSALLPWQHRRAHELHLEKHPEDLGELNVFVTSTNRGAHDLVTSYGFQECRYYFTMHRKFDAPIPDLPVPAGLRMVAFDPSYDQALHAAHDEAFQHDWGSTPLDEAVWQTRFTGSRGFRGALSRLVLDDDKIVAFALGYEYDADTAATGVRDAYVGQVGTLESHRGRGLASAALVGMMVEAQRAGFERASLDVDTDNPTGALGLYERLGFAQVSKVIMYRMPLA